MTVAAKVERPPRPSPASPAQPSPAAFSHFLANPEQQQQSVTEVIDLKFVGGLWERQIHCSTVQQQRAVQQPETSLMFIMFCSASFPEQLKAVHHILHRRHYGYFLLDVKQYPSHRTSSIQLNTFAHFLQRMCHFLGLLCCAVKVERCHSGPVSARPPYPVVHS